MKQAENNEIATLLRNLARRERGAQSAPDSAPRDFAAKGAHLDIDELSSYAERALPPSARARCTAHLADCDDCRKIVAQLSLAAGPLAEERKPGDSAVGGLTWAQKLSTLFSPRVIRYAMPALVLVVVAVAFFSWRQQRPGGFNDQIARNERSEPALASKSVGDQTAATARPGDSHSKPGELTKSQDQKQANAQSTPAAPARVAATTTDGQTVEEKRSGVVGGGLATASKAGKADAPAADKAAAEKDAYAPEPPPKPADKAQSQVAANQEQQKELAKNNAADERERGRDANVQQQANVQQRKGPARNDNEVASQRGPAKGEVQTASKMKAAQPSSAAGAPAEDDEAETRTVFGRRFRRLSNAWVDTAYKSSMSIRSVTRGTEEYRALVADEPAIDGFGKQLSGEVIVVWKGHAYRIN